MIWLNFFSVQKYCLNYRAGYIIILKMYLFNRQDNKLLYQTTGTDQ